MKIKCLALALLASASMPAFAADCATTVEANDKMQFNVKSIEIPKSCKSFDVTLKHTGKLPKQAMGHNIVVTSNADFNGVSTDGIKAGAAADYVKAGDTRIIAHSKMIGGGETTQFSIPVDKIKAGESYTFFCSFPGHAGLMKGTLKLGS
ncbi:MAG: azurin [Pigmentiphaga sp.]|nr:azurin [Pigmentiphaga sp.]